ncbi:hypothetical protein FRZ61_03910 [Hypericibacter adhaerens]|uniref:YjiS-like domain-containing protein n=1 Tax=Hypericibacter adhaerens TaxID=2602016 RepID=A0A5J6MT34_9PROT|nr:DUF1127 domain-containing protein [Hypericibacter adhaerens]QEX20474.1 hypothetical protein FRZ61_03910 [Hypericibacter adhaerens]
MNRLSLDLSVLRLAGFSRALSGVARGIGSSVWSLPLQTLQWHERRKGLGSLRELSDRELRDIGLRRPEIALAAYGLYDPHAQAPASPVATATRPVPAAKKADNGDDNPCIGCAA